MFKIVVSAVLLFSFNAFAKGNIANGKAKSVSCAACHGANGISTNDIWPSLAGQKAGYLAKQIRDFKSGARKDPVMTSQAMLIKDADIDDIAAYFASLK